MSDGEGRPTKKTDQMVEAICDLLERGNTRTSAASIAGINRATLYRWMQEDASFYDAVEKAEAMAQEAMLQRIRFAASTGMVVTRKDGEVVEYPGAWQAAAWLLERRWPQDFSRRDRVDVTFDVRKAAEKLATDAGLDVRDVLAEAESILAGTVDE